MYSWNINIAPKLGLTIISLIEVHMAMGKAHAENKEEEELVAQNSADQTSQYSKEMLHSLLPSFLPYRKLKKS